jgi:NitT/TauT family transport system substrate-binding protein
VRRIIAGAAVTLLGLTAAGCGAQAEDGAGGGDATVTVGTVQLPIFAPLYVADAKGYFEDEGLDVEIETIKSGQDAIPLASSGKLDAVLAGFSAGMFSAIETGLDVSVVGSMGVAPTEDEPSPSALIVAKDLYDSGDITSVEDLEGRKIGALGGEAATGAFYVSMALNEAGVEPESVEFVNLSSPDMPTALKTGGIDAAFVSAPFWSMAVEDGVAEKIWTTPEGTSGTGVIYGGGFAESEQAQPFFDALSRAAQDLQGDERYSEENLEIIGKATGQTVEEIRSEPLYTWYPDLHPLPDQLATMEQTWMQLGALDYAEPLPQDSYVDASFAESATE